MRLHFSQVNLQIGSSLRMTSVLDGEVQQLDAEGLRMWSNSSAYLNGDSVLLEVIAGPNTRGNRVTLDHLEIESGIEPVGASGQCGICGGVDDRTPSDEFWSARLMSVGCTVSVYNTCSCIITAGHCSSGTVIQFHVPASTSGCLVVNPPIADQFPITGVQFVNGGVGNDWGVMKVGTNNLGQRPVQRYGTYRKISNGASSLQIPIGSGINIFGFGVDLTCTLSQTQQLSTGAITNVLASSLQYNADVRGGNSGSGMINQNTLFGVVTHCQVGCPNHGTRVDLATFVAARSSLCTCACPGDITTNGVVNVDDLLRVITAWGPCPALPTVCPADVSPSPAGNGIVDVNDLLVVITGWGTCPLTPP
jgi:V8-like Glu-specific endopeptidase